MAELNANQRASSGSDITLSCSDGSSGLNSPREFGMHCSDMFLDTKDASIARNKHRTGWGWPLAATRYSITDDSLNNQGDALDNDDSAEKLKSDLILLYRKAEVTDLELQTLRKQIAKESKRGQDLLKEVACLKEERDGFKEECEKLKASQKHRNKSSYEGNPWALLDEVRQELNHEKNLNANLRLQLQKTQDSNSELILAVQDLEQMLEGRAQERQGQTIDVDDDDEEQTALEELVKQHSDAKDTYMREQKIMDLSSEIEMYRRDKDELEMQLEQLALDYEILKQENHDMSCKLEQSHLRQQLKLQYECSGSYATIYELENQVEKLESELSDSLITIKELEKHSQRVEDELEKQAQGFKTELEALACAKIEKEQQAIRVEKALRLEKQEFENQTEMLESELQKQSKEFSYALDTINELECRIQSFERELGKKAHGRNSDLEAITRAKEEQEQRAIRAEEALRLTRWKNANMASRLQDEFKRLSMEMQSTFEANEKVATKAMTEASQLRLMNNHLEELLQQAKEELQSVKEDYEAQASDFSKQLNMNNHLEELLQQAREELQSVKEDYEAQSNLNNRHEELLQQAREELQSVKEDYEAQASDLSKQLSLKSKEMDQMLVEIEEKSNQLDAQRENEDEVCRSLSAELLVLRAEVDRLTLETASLAEHIEQGEELKAELEQVKALAKERNLLVERTEREKDNLECLVDSIKKEAEKSLEELNLTRCLKDEQDLALKNLQSEMDSLRAQCEELRHSLFEHESEKDKLSKQVLQMKAELKKKDDALTNMERKLKDSNGRVAAAERTKASSKNKTELPSRGSKEAASLRVKIKLLEGQIKQRETTMETSANAFLEKEKDLNNKIIELERRLQELNQSSIVYYGDDDKKVVDNAGEIKFHASETLPNAEEASTINSRDEDKHKHDNDALLNETASLREKNSSMETELKELRERYSKISLKFAEVEGEREQLVMTLRSTKNAKKI